MKIRLGLTLAGAALALLTGCDSAPEERQNLLIVGSSTIYPFAVAVADQMKPTSDAEGASAATIESIGTGEGIERFCAGVGLDTPDIVNASRRMTREEYATCAANGVSDIAEIQLGLDGIVFISSVDEGLEFPLTTRAVYQALAASPFGSSQGSENWSDIDPAFPEAPIVVYGPPETSGTRTSLIDLVMEPVCTSDAGMKGFGKGSDRYETMCRTIRSDGKYLDQGEQDDVTLRKVAQNPRSIGVLGYSYYEENTDKVRAHTLGGVAPTEESIMDGSYPASRPLYMYVKKAHLEQMPTIRDYVGRWTQMWGVGGTLEGMGLVPSGGEAMEAAMAAATDLPTLDPGELPSDGSEAGADQVATVNEDEEAPAPAE
ncbi:substrate-binding domain-containing protein [Alteriqipengyuania sp.]|uniref:substrate-binding domain-containing protein n=1 Tax=Alteriqipengyuania sp. TaxID=2800692 RepID=UPI0035134DA5